MEVDEVLAQATDGLGPGERATLQAERAAIDLDAALSLARDALGEAVVQPTAS